MLDNPLTRVVSSIAITGIFFGIIFILLPPYPMPEGLLIAIDWLFETLWGFDFIFPVITALSVFGLIIMVDLAFAIFKLILFFKKHLTRSV